MPPLCFCSFLTFFGHSFLDPKLPLPAPVFFSFFFPFLFPFLFPPLITTSMFCTRGATRMVRTRPLTSIVGSPRRWGGSRGVNLLSKEPTGQPVEPTKTTKDSLVRSPFLCFLLFFTFLFSQALFGTQEKWHFFSLLCHFSFIYFFKKEAPVWHAGKNAGTVTYYLETNPE